MASLLYFGLVVASLALILVNKFLIWKIWPKIFFPQISFRHKTIVAVFIIDPLVASIICPLAKDLYFTLDWLQTCDLNLTFFVTCALLVTYGAGLVMSFNIVSTLIPSDQTFHSEPKFHHTSSFICFTFSTMMNLVLTWMTLFLTVQRNDGFDPSEECLPYMTRDQIFFVCALSFGFQAFFVIFYAHLSRTIHQHHKPLLLPSLDKDIAITESYFINDLLMYTSISVICLLLSHGLRFAFTMCSCWPFLSMYSGMYWTNWLILAKLPISGLAYCALSRFL